MENNNLYYNSKYCATVPIESYGDQFKDYLDSKLSGLANSDDFKTIEENLTKTIVNVETNIGDKIDASDKHVICNIHQIVNDSTNKTICNIKNAVTESTEETACNIQNAKDEIVETIQNVSGDLTCLEKNINSSITTSADNVVKAVEVIAGNIESNLSNAITVSADNVVKANEVIASNIEKNMSNVMTTSIEGLKNDLNDSINAATDNIVQAAETIAGNVADNVVKATEVIAGNIENNISGAITTSADNVVKATEVIAGNIEKNLADVVVSTSSNTDKTVKSEATLMKEKIAKVREDLIAAINNSDSLTSVGFSDLNASVIANKEDAVYRINRQASVNKEEVLNAIYGKDFEPYTVYGGTVYNIVHFGVQSLTENDVINLPSVTVNTYDPDVAFSIKIKDVAVIGMNDDATGEIYASARTQNELNIVFAYPKKYEATEIYDSIDDNLTKSFEKKDIQINGVDYIVAMQPSKVVNLYDPQWETPLDYTLNYLLKIG